MIFFPLSNRNTKNTLILPNCNVLWNLNYLISAPVPLFFITSDHHSGTTYFVAFIDKNKNITNINIFSSENVKLATIKQNCKNY